MRLTKKVLKEQKNAFSGRIKEICHMKEFQLRLEHERIFPAYLGRELLSAMSLAHDLIQDALEQSLPSHWFD